MHEVVQTDFYSFLSHNYFSGAIARTGAYFGSGTGVIIFNEVACNGNEARLVDCQNGGSGFIFCFSAGVTCQPSK